MDFGLLTRWYAINYRYINFLLKYYTYRQYTLFILTVLIKCIQNKIRKQYRYN